VSPNKFVCWTSGGSCLLALLVSLPTSAQSDRPAVDPSFEERVSVTLRSVDFLVVGRHGEPVVDLRKDEVELRDGGVVQEILDLTPAHSLRDDVGTLGRSHSVSSGVTAATGSPTSESRPVEQENRRWVMIFFDVRNLSYQGRVRASLALHELVENALAASDRVALVVDEDELRVLVPFAGGRDELSAYLANPARISSRSRDLERRLTDLREDAESCRDAADPLQCAQQAASAFAFETGRETEASLERLEALLRSLAAIPDRKILFYVSEGFLTNPGDVASAAVQHSLGQSGYNLTAMEQFLMRDYRPRVGTLYQIATRSRTGFYVVNTGRKMTDDLFSAERAYAGGPHDLPKARSDPFEATWQQVRQLHHELALATGGGVVFKRDPAGFLEDQLHKARGVYTVSYTPRGQIADRGKIKIKLSRKGARIAFLPERRRTALQARRLLGSLTIAQNETDRENRIIRAELAVAGRHISVAHDSDPPLSIVSVFFDLRDQSGRSLKDSFELVAVPRTQTNDAGLDELRRPFALKVPAGNYALRVDVSDVHGAARGSFQKTFSVGPDSALEDSDSLETVTQESNQP
jgi:VWFA-related protein